MILNRPGSTIRARLDSTKNMAPDEQVFAEIRVMTHADSEWIEDLARLGLSNFEVARRAIGKMVQSIEGLKDHDGNPWQMAREADGYLTTESAEFLIPLHGELTVMIGNGARLTSVDRKNC